MLRTLRTRRRPRYGAQVCAVMASLLLLLSVSILHSKLKSPLQENNELFTQHDSSSIDDLDANPLVEDNLENNNNRDDLIDVLDVIEEEQVRVIDEEEILRGVEDDSEPDNKLGLGLGLVKNKHKGYYWDHVVGARRKAFDKRSSGDSSLWEEMVGSEEEDGSRVVFGSDDQPVNEDVRVKFDGIRGIEDALLLKTRKGNGNGKESPLREGWADWFEKKGDFLRRDKMFRSNLEILNPANNPLLQDPDGVGLTFLTRGDKLLQKSLLNEVGKKSIGLVENRDLVKRRGMDLEDIRGKKVNIGTRNEVKRVKRRTLDANGSGTVDGKKTGSSSDLSELTKNVDVIADGDIVKEKSMLHDKRSNSEALELNNGFDKTVDSSMHELAQQSDTKSLALKAQTKSELSDHKYADGRRWGYFPGLYAHLSFSEFMREFFQRGNCSMRVFMVWNSSPWMYTVRHQRGLESLLYHHPDACVVVFSETIDLDFFNDFVKEGFKVAVAMPNLDELLKDTPAHIFASVWFEWRKTKFYQIHYSELVRLAALHKYGGLYLDSDVVVLKPLSSLNNSIGLEDEPAKSSFNGAVMAFSKNSRFIMECLGEFFSTYDDTLLRWNGADLLTRTVKKFLMKKNNSDKQLELKIQPSSMFFPISSKDITRYFTAPADETERNQQYILLQKILDGSYTFHFWNGLTSPIIPEPESVVAKILNHHCIHCLDLL